jgi:hypothetical protein
VGRFIIANCTGWIVLLLLVIVGHDLVMTAGAHASPLAAVDRDAPAMSHAGSDVQHRTLGQFQPYQPGDPSESTACGTTRIAVLPGPLGLAPDTFDLTGPTLDLQQALLDVTDHRWQEPTAPPGVRRALVQVYRI